MTDDACDCLVLGGGPAGCALALLLVRRGHTVVLLDHGRGPCSGPNETLLASSLPMLARIGMAEPLRQATAPDLLRHGAWWGSDSLEWRDPESTPGLWLQRGSFERALRQQVAACGVDVRCPARWRRLAAPTFEVVSRDGSQSRLTPRFVVLATGSAKVPAYAPAVTARGTATRSFTFTGSAAERDRGTAVVEAVPQGWIWSHAPATGEMSAAVVVDADAVVGSERSAWLRSALAAAKGPAGRMVAARLTHAKDATARLCAADATVLRLGDAAATIDPMASQGVGKALAAAEHAAVILDAALRQPAWWPRLLQLHAQWEANLFHAHTRLATDFYRREQRFAAAAFWRRRHQALPVELPAPDMPLRAAAAVVSARVLVRRGDEIVEADGAMHTQTGHSLSHVGYVPVAPLLACFTTPTPLPIAAQHAGAQASLFVLPPAAVHAAMLELLRLGWLTAAANAPDSR